jgi:hypothetical protein
VARALGAAASFAKPFELSRPVRAIEGIVGVGPGSCFAAA